MPILGGRPAVPARLLHPVALARGLAAGALPVPRPRRPAADPAEGGGRRTRSGSRIGLPERPRAARAGLGGPGRPGAAAAARLRRGRERRRGPRRHRPPLRRRHRPPAACRSCCSASAACARSAPTARSPGTPSPRCSTPTRVTRASSAWSASASSPRPRPLLRRGAGGRPRRHRLHHPHPGARRASTASRVDMIGRQFGGDNAWPTVPVERILALGAEDEPGRVQHGRDGHAAGPAGQRRLASCTARSAGRCSRACGRDSTSTRCRSAPSPTACTRPPGSAARSWSWPAGELPALIERAQGWESVEKISDADALEHPRHAAASGWSRRPAGGSAQSWQQQRRLRRRARLDRRRRSTRMC